MQLSLSVFNVDELARALAQAPALTYKYAKQEIGRIGNRVKKRFMADRLSGAPGIKGGEWKRQHKRHVRVRTAGDDLGSLHVSLTLSRFLSVHETGATITAYKKGARDLRIPIGERRGIAFRGQRFDRNAQGHIRGLFVLARPGKPSLLVEQVNGKIVPRYILVKSVTIPPRLKFRETTTRLFTEQMPKLREAVARGMKQSFSQELRRVSTLARKVA